MYRQTYTVFIGLILSNVSLKRERVPPEDGCCAPRAPRYMTNKQCLQVGRTRVYKLAVYPTFYEWSKRVVQLHVRLLVRNS